MALYRDTDLGRITVSNKLFAGMIEQAFVQEDCKDLIWPSTRKGKLIVPGSKNSLAEIGTAIEVERSLDEKRIDITLPVITRFGASISALTERVCDYIAAVTEEKSGYKPNVIKVIVTGVKSRNMARRNLEVIKTYEAE